jgi:hypothetical protein
MAIDGLSHDLDEVSAPDGVRLANGRPRIPAPERAAGQTADRAPGNDERAEAAGESSNKNELTKAVLELAGENADLYRKNAAQDQQIARLEADLHREKARHATWAKEISARDEARDKRDEVTGQLIADLGAELAELRQQLADQAGSDGSGKLPDRFEKTVERGKQKQAPSLDRAKPSNEFLNVEVAVGSGVLAVTGIAIGTVPAADTAALLTSVLAIGGAAVPWWRKRREDRNAD